MEMPRSHVMLLLVVFPDKSPVQASMACRMLPVLFRYHAVVDDGSGLIGAGIVHPHAPHQLQALHVVHVDLIQLAVNCARPDCRES
jgi:hypothetical protein